MLPVLNGRETLKNALRQAVHNLETVGVKVLGTVINNAGVSKGCYYYGSTHE
jgi:Mrp family chromosome partitioning ATPase